MDLRLITQVLRHRAELARHDTWTPAQIAALSHGRVETLRRMAVERSRFYAAAHAGAEHAPLAALPLISKSDLMANFDAAVTAPGITHTQVQQRLVELATTRADPGRPWSRRWWVAGTAGTTGEPAVLVWDRSEWAWVLASYARAIAWAGVPSGPGHRLRTAFVSTTVPTHQSAVVGASLRSPLVRTLRLDARAPVDELVPQLGTFRPDVLVGYASVLRLLAQEQSAGRLAIAPVAVMSASEVLSAPSAAMMQTAWGRAPFDVYAATETAGIASSCPRGQRHLYEDLVVAESVDDDGVAVPDGEAGSRLAVTVLFAHTVPLIRYVLSDRVTISKDRCGCGLPYRVLQEIGGRAEDTLRHSTGEPLHVEALRSVVESAPITTWRARTDGRTVHVTVVPMGRPFDPTGLTDGLRDRLRELGRRDFDVVVHVAASLERTPTGKAPTLDASAGSSGSAG